MDLNYFCSLIGYATVAYILFQFIGFVLAMFRWYVLTSIGFVKDLKKYGEWVIVTGGTDGIGKEYARQFAKRGFKVVLISRTKEKLEQVSKEIEDEFHVETKFICFDFTKTVGYDKIEEELKDLNVGILVNNVGTAYLYPEGYFTSDINKVYDNLYCNVFSDIHMTHMVLKGMVERKRGLILHISSVFMYFDYPGLIYFATKAFMGKFCRPLQLEGSRIDHQLVTPGIVSTKLVQKKHQFDIPTAENYVKSAIRTIGIADVTCGYLIHEIQRVCGALIPASVMQYILKKLM